MSISGQRDGTVAMVSCSLGKPYALAKLTFGWISFYTASKKESLFWLTFYIFFYLVYLSRTIPFSLLGLRITYFLRKFLTISNCFLSLNICLLFISIKLKAIALEECLALSTWWFISSQTEKRLTWSYSDSVKAMISLSFYWVAKPWLKMNVTLVIFHWDYMLRMNLLSSSFDSVRKRKSLLISA